MIKIEEVLEVTKLLITHLQRSGVDTIDFDWDYYWNIPVEELYNPYEVPTDLNLGQLSEDWEKLQQIAASDSPPIGYALTWLSAILRAVGEKNVA